MRGDDRRRPQFRGDDRSYLAKRCSIEDTFLPLNTSPVSIFVDNKSTRCFQKLYPMSRPHSRRPISGPYYIFYEDYEDVINECLSLRKQIDLLVRRGPFIRYAQDKRWKEQIRDHATQGNQVAADQPTRIVSIIHGQLIRGLSEVEH